MEVYIANSVYGNSSMPPRIVVGKFEAVATGFYSQNKFIFGRPDALEWWHDLVDYTPPKTPSNKTIKEGQLWPRGN